MSKFLPIGERLREERERLGLNQTDFAALGGATRKTQYNYETGERAPDAAYLAAIIDAGVDVFYILTGVKSEKPPLNERQKALLDNYENTDEFGKRIIEATAAEAASPVKKSQVGNNVVL